MKSLTSYTIRNIFFIVLLVLSSNHTISQLSDYKDVGVIINENSQTSIDIGNYFKQERNIPNENIIYVNAPTTEVIDSLEFENIRVQIEDYLISNELEDSINYIVTTKGVPLKVERENCTSIQGFNCHPFDAEIALILGDYESYVSEPNTMNSLWNPYFNLNKNFSREEFGFYLVTRLDAYSKEDVFELIDRSAIGLEVDKAKVQTILDISKYGAYSVKDAFNNRIEPAYDYLKSENWNVTYDKNASVLTDQTDVFAYSMFIGDSDHFDGKLNNTWLEGSISTLFHYHSAMTFDKSNNPDNYLLIADFIEEGATASHSFAYMPSLSHSLRPNILYERYFDTENNFNLAESYYMADPFLAWQSVVIGDPKAWVNVTSTLSVSDLNNNEHDIKVFPNPSSGVVNIEGDNIEKITVYDMKGVSVYEKDENSEKLNVDLSFLKSGVYHFAITTNKNVIRKRVILSK